MSALAPALDGITVVALEQAVAAPFATRQLADLGAQVIKVERPGGGDFAREYDTSVLGQSSFFVWLNRGKKSVTLDVKDPRGAELLHRLLATADVFVQNLAPGAAERLGLGAAALAARYPRLVVCDISGYGEGGPLEGRKAYDLLLQCETGLASVTGTPRAPAKVGISVADIAAGVYAYSGILTALLVRERTGVATPVAVSLLDALAEWMSVPAYLTLGTGLQPGRYGLAHATIAPYGPYRTGTGDVVLAVQNDREWVRLCTEVVGSRDLARDARFTTNEARVRHRVELDTVLSACFAGLTADEVSRRLDDAGIANTRFNDVAGLLSHPQLAARGRWVAIETPAGEVPALLPPAVHAGRPAVMGAVPGLGAHTASILAEIGVDTDELARLRSRDVV